MGAGAGIGIAPSRSVIIGTMANALEHRVSVARRGTGQITSKAISVTVVVELVGTDFGTMRYGRTWQPRSVPTALLETGANQYTTGFA